MSGKKPAQRPTVLAPMYALVGATELTANALRELGASADAEAGGERRESTPVLSRLRGDVLDIARGTTRVPGLAVEQVVSGYTALTARGRQTVSGVVPLARKARTEGETVARAEEAKARREARRLARQAGETVSRGRDLAGHAAGEAGRSAERTLEVVRTEASHVVEAVSHPERTRGDKARRSAVRRAAVADTAVTSTSPAGGEEPTKVERVSAGVEAGASSTARRSPRTRKQASAGAATTGTAKSGAAKTGTARTGPSTSGTATTDSPATSAPAGAPASRDRSGSAKKGTAQHPTAGAQTSATTPRSAKTAKTTNAAKTAPAKPRAAKKTSAVAAATPTEPQAHLDIPTPADLAETIEASSTDD